MAALAVISVAGFVGLAVVAVRNTVGPHWVAFVEERRLGGLSNEVVPDEFNWIENLEREEKKKKKKAYEVPRRAEEWAEWEQLLARLWPCLWLCPSWPSWMGSGSPSPLPCPWVPLALPPPLQPPGIVSELVMVLAVVVGSIVLVQIARLGLALGLPLLGHRFLVGGAARVRQQERLEKKG
jgi:hypothetical protein